MTADAPKILVMGCGAIGGITAGHLTEIGADVTAITTNEAIAAAVRQHGYRLRGESEPREVSGRIELGIPPGSGPCDYVLLATQPPQVEEAAATALPYLADDGAMVCFQNGLCEERVARLAGAHRVIGGIVAWGGSMPEPGVYDRTATGGFTLGRLDGSTDDALRTLGNLLEAVGPVTYTTNLVGARWSKLALNCAISSLPTLAGERLGKLVLVRRYRRLVLDVMTEVVEVARREKVSMEKVAGTLDLEWITLTEAEQRQAGSAALTAKHALLIAVGLRYRRMRSSMLAAIERGRTPAVDFLNGEVVTRARTHGVAVPLNEAVVAAVWALARGEQPMGRATLDRLYERTRPR
jgi:2-dehydropantoate 2-reductase